MNLSFKVIIVFWKFLSMVIYMISAPKNLLQDICRTFRLMPIRASKTPCELGGETAILNNKSGDDFCCLYHVGTRLKDLENTISPLKSLVPFLLYWPYWKISDFLSFTLEIPVFWHFLYRVREIWEVKLCFLGPLALSRHGTSNENHRQIYCSILQFLPRVQS